MKNLFFLTLLLSSIAANAADVFGGATYLGEYDNLDNGVSSLDLGVSFNPHDNFNVEVIGQYLDTKTLRNDVMSPNDTWYLGVRAKYTFASF